MILAPAQWKTLQDAYALGHFLGGSDIRLREQALKLAEAAAEMIDLAEKLAEREELTAPF